MPAAKAQKPKQRHVGLRKPESLTLKPKLRSTLQTVLNAAENGLNKGTVKVVVAAYLTKDDEVKTFVSDSTASRVEIMGLTADLHNLVVNQKL